MKNESAYVISTPEQLREHYGEPLERSLKKELTALNAGYRAFIQASPFVVIASVGPDGVDISPRGDAPGFVEVIDANTLALPDRRGNNRVDTLNNIVIDPRVSLFFMIPNVGESLRVIGKARIVIDPALLERHAVHGKPPSSLVLVDIERVYFQCQKALVRSALWNPAVWPDERPVPSAGSLMQSIDEGFDGEGYDAGYAEYMKQTLY